MLYSVGFAGTVCSGKSTILRNVQNILQQKHSLNVHTIDADKLAHQVYSPGKFRQQLMCALVFALNHGLTRHIGSETCRRLGEIFGAHVLTADKAVDRRELAKIVFADENALQDLNGIVWPELKKELAKCFADLERAPLIVLLEAAVMVSAKWTDLVDHTVYITTSLDTAKRRTRENKHVAASDVEKRFRAQLSADAARAKLIEQNARSFAIIQNDKDGEESMQKISDQIVQHILEQMRK